MSGYYPFKDYWTIKEPFIDLIQAIFFKIFGVSWFSYVLHASLFNCLITISTFFILKRFKLNKNLCFFYSLCVAILTYPTAGTPFSDHHTLILCLLSFLLRQMLDQKCFLVLIFFLWSGFSYFIQILLNIHTVSK